MIELLLRLLSQHQELVLEARVKPDHRRNQAVLQAAQVVQVLRFLLRRNQAAQPAQSLAVQPLEPQIIMLANLTQKNFRSLRISIGTLVFWLPRNLKVAIEASLAVFGLAERIGGGQSVSAICAT